jgi:cysteine desulfurase
LCKANKTFLHSDIAQMAGKVPVDVNELGLDLASISSHKVQNTINSLLGLSRQYTVIRRSSGPRLAPCVGLPAYAHVHNLPVHLACAQMYGPKGQGALYIRRKPRVKMEPLFSGGGQER